MTRSIGAAAVLETAAETPPTVIASQFLYSEAQSQISARQPASIGIDADRGHLVLEKVNILKKSITKGGLSRKRQFQVLRD